MNPLRSALLDHVRSHPALQVSDILKFIHQSAFGCEHMAPSPDTALQRICEEWEKCKGRCVPLVEALDGDCARVSLSALDAGLAPATLAKAFSVSSHPVANGRESAEEKLELALSLAREGELPVTWKALEDAARAWRNDGYPACRHSDAFKAAYSPAYRVVDRRFSDILDLLIAIDTALRSKRRVIRSMGGSFRS